MDMIGLSGVEKSTDQVKKPLYIDSLTAWIGKIPKDVEADIAEIAPMIGKLGYDLSSTSPSYGRPDAEVTAKYNEWVKTQESKPNNAPIVHVTDQDNKRQRFRNMQTKQMP